MAIYDEVKRALQDIMAPQLAELRGELRAGLAEVRADMESRFAQVETRFVQLEARFRAEFSEVRSEIAQLRVEMRQEVNNVHTDLVRIEQVFSARLQSMDVLERVVRLEERLSRT